MRFSHAVAACGIFLSIPRGAIIDGRAIAQQRQARFTEAALYRNSHWATRSPYAYPLHVMAKHKLLLREHEERRNNWLAPAGSLQERRMFEKLAKQKGLDDHGQALVYAYLEKPDGFAERNALFWDTAKKQVLGPVIYDMALERHKNLSPDEWLVACLTAQNFKQEEMVPIIGKSVPSIEKTVASIKKIMRDQTYDVETVNLAQITRWFLGL